MSDYEWKKFYDENPPPPGLLEIKAQITNFCNHHMVMSNNVVLITSGGTTVPLEHSTVRFVDNFSAGNRGAASAEYFLKAGYAVIYMHRTKALEPFLRLVNVGKLLESSNPCIDVEDTHTIEVKKEVYDELLPVIRDYQKALMEKMLLKIEFTTLSSYLHILYMASQALRPMGRDTILYLAAAVSDFYIPQKDMSEHKISSEESLSLTLQIVPKMLQPLVKNWIPEAFIVSFKLETDPSILIKKARAALEKYGHKLVIANELHTRRQKVVFVTKEMEKTLLLTEGELVGGKEIEEVIVQELIKMYKEVHCI